MDFKMEKGVIVRVAADDDKKKSKGKGDGVAAAIGLLQELRGFKEKVDACIEAQDIAEYKSALAEPAKALESLYKALLKIAEGGIRSLNAPEAEAEAGAPAPEAKPALPITPSIPSESKIG